MIIFNSYITNKPIINKSINNKPVANKKFDKVSFGFTSRVYSLDIGTSNIRMCNLTQLFRKDVEWLNFAKYVQKLFKDKDKVNIIQFAASSGAEAYTQIISLLETGSKKDVKKFFPIQAYDIDSTIVNVAKSGLINLNKKEIDILSTNNINVKKYFNLNKQQLPLENENSFFLQKTYKAKDILTENVIFEEGDMFKLVNDINDNSNTIVLCRNCLPYFNKNLQEKFIQTMAKNLKEKSLLVIGDFDFDFGVSPLLLKYRFQEVMRNVYQKIDNKSDVMTDFKEEPQIPIFEKLKNYLQTK